MDDEMETMWKEIVAYFEIRPEGMVEYLETGYGRWMPRGLLGKYIALSCLYY
jgi:hypothetical protein